MRPVAVVLVALLGLSPRPGIAAVDLTDHASDVPARDVEANIGRGDALTRSGDFVAAAEAYASAWTQLGAEDRVGPLGRLLVQKATDAYRSAAAQQAANPALLDAPHALLQQYFLEARAVGQPDAPALHEELLRLERQREAAAHGMGRPGSQDGPSAADDLPLDHPSKGDAPAQGAAKARQHVPSPSEAAPDARADREVASRGDPAIRTAALRRTGIALVGVGLASVIAGAVLVGTGVRDRNYVQGRQELHDQWLESPDARANSPDELERHNREYDAWVDDSERIVRLRMGLGGAALSLGTTGIVLGAILWARRPARAHNGANPR